MSIYRDKATGRWRFDFDRYFNGRRTRKRRLLPAGWTRAQAEAYDRKEGASLSALVEGIAKPRRTVDEAVRRYLAERAPELKHGMNLARELEATRDWWTGRAIEELPAICAEYAADQLGALAPATIKNRIAYLRAACRWAWKRHGMADQDPGARVVAPSVRNARDVALTRAQMLSLCRACEHRPTRATIRVLWYSGMRLGEARTALRVPGAFVIADSKAGTPRLVPIHPRIRSAALVPMPARGTLYYWWGRSREAAGLEGVNLHDLRHSAASAMVNAGIDLGTVGAVLGHKTAQTTKRYAHHAIERLSEAVGTIGRRRA